MKLIVVKKIRANKNTVIMYARDKKGVAIEELNYCYEIEKVMKEIYKTHHNFYLREFGYSYEVTEAAGWHPGHRSFECGCAGFAKAVQDGFKIDIELIYTIEPVVDVLKNLYAVEKK